MHSGFKLRVVTFDTKRRRSLKNVCKQRSMERSGVKCFLCAHVFDLTNLKCEKRRNVGKLDNELNIVNQLVDLQFLVVCKHYWKLKEPPCAYSANNHRWLALSFREQLTRLYHKESASPHPAIVPIEGAVLFELSVQRIFFKLDTKIDHHSKLYSLFLKFSKRPPF
jgi:hypothetical protein